MVSNQGRQLDRLEHAIRLSAQAHLPSTSALVGHSWRHDCVSKRMGAHDSHVFHQELSKFLVLKRHFSATCAVVLLHQNTDTSSCILGFHDLRVGFVAKLHVCWPQKSVSLLVSMRLRVRPWGKRMWIRSRRKSKQFVRNSPSLQGNEVVIWPSIDEFDPCPIPFCLKAEMFGQ